MKPKRPLLSDFGDSVKAQRLDGTYFCPDSLIHVIDLTEGFLSFCNMNSVEEI